ncbi:dynein heavy chain Dhc1 [Schizosaccharomyces cryophilus OY26]|uniref:Dynein heavy chain, cytoplasmic n=1 Tax=Schizosaccharomyces cryophilus (strain OY26 / ATCC MYA-4695 / CBS 11777 / NBRC 106824 / NRRL Y48691) TaxID=653667 RepID=S9VWS2_SCHCR|nr:dynein heavy chain Dhc1 [Schizosaccharomyces cryophilus OY26]EPY50395.1 dynein heavy chain Dhc1 [Schizosaccharomyces cryophilus OY26]
MYAYLRNEDSVRNIFCVRIESLLLLDWFSLSLSPVSLFFLSGDVGHCFPYKSFTFYSAIFTFIFRCSLFCFSFFIFVMTVPLERTSIVSSNLDISTTKAGALNILDYLKQVISISCSLDQELTLAEISKCEEFTDAFACFLQDSDQLYLYLFGVIRSPTSQSDPKDLILDKWMFRIEYNYTVTSDCDFVLVFLKQTKFVDLTAHLQKQLVFAHLPLSACQNDNPFDSSINTVHSYVKYALEPFFLNCAKETPEKTSGTLPNYNLQLSNTKKVFSELELSLANLQSDRSVPNVTLYIHPVIKDAIHWSKIENTEISVQCIPHNTLSNPKFLNSLNITVHSWMKSINQLVETSQTEKQGSTSQEIRFWHTLCLSYNEVYKQLTSLPVKFTLEVLNFAKRFHTTASFLNNTNLRTQSDTANRIAGFLIDIPLPSIHGASSLDSLHESIVSIHVYFMKRWKSSCYPLSRTITFLNCLADDFASKLIEILSSKQIMAMPFADLQHNFSIALNTLTTWDSSIKEFLLLVKHTLSKRKEVYEVAGLNERPKLLSKRLQSILLIRETHENLTVTISSLSSSDQDGEGLFEAVSGSEFSASLDLFQNVDVLDCTEDGRRKWILHESKFGDILCQFDNEFVSFIKEKFRLCENTTQMISIFLNYNTLLSRPKVRNAVREYQVQLINGVSQDVMSLKSRFTDVTSDLELFAMHQLRDIPPVSGAIMWSSQVTRRLQKYFTQLDVILGNDWATYNEGSKLKSDAQSLQKNLDPLTIYKTWLNTLSLDVFDFTTPIFKIVPVKELNCLELSVTLDSQLMMLIKEFRTLSSMGYEVPERFSKVISNSQKLQSVAANLSSSAKLYNQSLKIVETSPVQKYLLMELEYKIQCHISENLLLTWEDFLNDDKTSKSERDLGNNCNDISSPYLFIYQLNSLINIYCSKYESVVRTCSEIDSNLMRLENDEYIYENFLGILKEIQIIVDRLYVDGYSNLHKVVVIINDRIQNILIKKLKKNLDDFSLLLERTDDNYITDLFSSNLFLKRLLDKSVILQPISMSLKNGAILLEPSLQVILTSVFGLINYLFSSVENLPAIYLRSYPISGGVLESKSSTFVGALGALDVEVVRVFNICSNALAEVKCYIATFKRYQVFDTRLLDKASSTSLQPSDLFHLVQHLAYSKKSVNEIDDEFRMGSFKVDLVPFRSRATYNLSKWIDFYFELFSQELTDSARNSQLSLSYFQSALNNIRLDWQSLKEANESVLNLRNSLNYKETSSALLELLKSAEDVFKNVNYRLRNDWISYDQMVRELTPFFIALDEINDYYVENRSKLIKFANNSSGDLRIKLALFFSNWDLEKLRFHDIGLENFSTLIEKYSENLNCLIELLGEQSRLEISLGIPPSEFSDTSRCSSEVSSYKDLITFVSENLKVLQNYEKTPWLFFDCQAFENELTDHIKELNNCPPNIKSLEPYVKLNAKITDLLDIMPLLRDLKRNNVQKEHWQKLLSAIGIVHYDPYENWTLGYVLGLKLSSHIALIKEVVQEAAEEASIRESLQSICRSCAEYEFQFLLYDNRTYILKDCDRLVSDCEEWIDQLNAIKISESYNQVKSLTDDLTEKISQLLDFLNIWIEVQQYWTYLDGVFSKNEVFQSLLPQTTVAYYHSTKSYTQGINLLLSSKGIVGFQKLQLPKDFAGTLLQSLFDIKKSLVDYFESERLKFPRLFFLGDEDLLELVCHIDSNAALDKHIGTLFPGIKGLVLNQEEGTIEKVVTDEQLNLALSSPVKIKQKSGCFDWVNFIEKDIRNVLLGSFSVAYSNLNQNYGINGLNVWFPDWLKSFPSQILLLCFRCFASQSIKQGINAKELTRFDSMLEGGIDWLSNYAIDDDNVILRKKVLLFINEKLHYRSLLKTLVEHNYNDYYWSREIKCSYGIDESGKHSINVEMFTVTFPYAFHYVEIENPFVYTELTRESFSTLIHAIHLGFGGAPSGPAGTGKTETVKALGAYLGRYVFVFNCDDSFNYKVIRRILTGLCQLGVYACFDEFNRLNPGTLSSVSQDIQLIQTKSKRGSKNLVPIDGKMIETDQSFSIFVTLNPNYHGRSELPCNLKRLFRTVWMETPNSFQICQVLLYSNGFQNSSCLANVLTSFFENCAKQFSQVSYYDFGLRTIRAIIKISCKFRRNNLLKCAEFDDLELIYQAIQSVTLPRLNVEDAKVFEDLRRKYFEVISIPNSELTTIKGSIEAVLKDYKSIYNFTYLTQKILQLHQLSEVYSGIIIYGCTGSGKTNTWKTLLDAFSKLQIKNEHYVISPKSIDKDSLFGTLDLTTHEWTDGIFTKILRSAIGSETQYWIIFDDDITPDWVEAMNSLLDDNRFLTLPDGERIPLSDNVRILFEVDNIQSATMATISRCGIVYVDDQPMANNTFIQPLLTGFPLKKENSKTSTLMYETVISILSELPIVESYEFASNLSHIMEFEKSRYKDTLLLYFRKEIINAYRLLEVNYSYDEASLTAYMRKKFLLSVAWASIGDSDLESQLRFTDWIKKNYDLGTAIPDTSKLILDLDVDAQTQKWICAKESSENDFNDGSSNLSEIVKTPEVIRYGKLINDLLFMDNFLVFCGPPGSGKSMTMLHFLNDNEATDVAVMNFSASTSAYAIIRFLERNTMYSLRANSSYIAPKNKKLLAIFFDEINLPKSNQDGGNDALCFLRCVLHYKGFWHPKLKKWINLKRIVIFGACNPPTDYGRSSLSSRILRKSIIIQYGYPSFDSLIRIYKPICDRILSFADYNHSWSLNERVLECSVKVYEEIKLSFSSKDDIIHTYTPRELTKWFYCLQKLVESLSRVTFEQLLQLWYHEACRVFLDRLNKTDFELGESKLQSSLYSQYEGFDFKKFKNYYICDLFCENYSIVTLNTVKFYLQKYIEDFSIAYPNSLFVPTDKNCLDAIRINRVFVHNGSHAIIYGEYGSNQKSVLEFVSWKLGYKLFFFNPCLQPQFFDLMDELKTIVKLVVADDIKLCFVIDHFQCVNSDVFEVMNNLLTGSDISCLFTDEEWENLRKSVMLRYLCKIESEVIKKIQDLISENLHVFFIFYTSSYKGLNVLSPALINRCTTIYFQPPDKSTIQEVFSNKLLGFSELSNELNEKFLAEEQRLKLVSLMSGLHVYMKAYFEKKQSNLNLSPNVLTDFIILFVKLFKNLRDRLFDEKDHVDSGLKKLKETSDNIQLLKTVLYEQETALNTKTDHANTRLHNLMKAKQEVEVRQKEALDLEHNLRSQNEEIESKTSLVLKELSMVKPAIVEAKASVSNIKKSHLSELRSLSHPPTVVKLTMEAVCKLLGHKVTSWKSVQSLLKREDFITNVLNFDTEKQLSPSLRKRIESEYFCNASLKYEVVNRASKACGPLFLWIRSHCNYSKVLQRVSPLNDNVSHLKAKGEEMQHKLLNVKSVSEGLDKELVGMQEDYATLITEVHALKLELTSIQDKVKRSLKIMNDMSTEKSYWENFVNAFEERLSELNGHSILVAFLVNYTGLLDPIERETVIEHVSSVLIQENYIDSKKNIMYFLQELFYNVLGEAKLSFKDDHFITNMAIISECVRPALVIDPSFYAFESLKACFGDSVICLSLSSKTFKSQLKAALKLRKPIIIKDVEYWCPLLDLLITPELYSGSGNVSIKVSKEVFEISVPLKVIIYSNTFNDSFITYKISSFTTIVNFTPSSSGLSKELLNSLIDMENSDLLKSKHYTRERLVQIKSELLTLQKNLLTILSTLNIDILANDDVLIILNTIRSSIDEKENLDLEWIMLERKISEMSCHFTRSIELFTFLILVFKVMSVRNSRYDTSMKFFASLYNQLLLKIKSLSETAAKPEDLFKFIMKIMVENCCLSILPKDRSLFAVLISACLFYRESEILWKSIGVDLSSIMGRFNFRKSIVCEPQVSRNVQEFYKKLEKSDISEVDYYSFIKWFSETVLGINVLNIPTKLDTIISEGISNDMPLIVIPLNGIDIKQYMEQCLAEREVNCITIPMGSLDSEELADVTLSKAEQEPCWVFLENIHLSQRWLESLSSKLKAGLHPKFRMVCTSDISFKFPTWLSSNFRYLYFDLKLSFKEVLMRNLKFVFTTELGIPQQYGILSFLIAWIHTILFEKLCIIESNEQSRTDINDVDLFTAMNALSACVKLSSSQRTSEDLPNFPWDMFQELVINIAYAPKVSSQNDLSILSSMLQYFVKQLREGKLQNLSLASNQRLNPPLTYTLVGCENFTKGLPDNIPSVWLGMESTLQSNTDSINPKGVVKDLSNLLTEIKTC